MIIGRTTKNPPNKVVLKNDLIFSIKTPVKTIPIVHCVKKSNQQSNNTHQYNFLIILFPVFIKAHHKSNEAV